MAGWNASRAKFAGWPLGSPINAAKPEDRQADALFHNSEIVVLHGFIKKTQSTALREMEVARQRMREVKQ